MDSSDNDDIDKIIDDEEIDDDQIKDPQDDQIFDEELIREGEQEPQIIDESKKLESYDDEEEEKDSDDSGLGDEEGDVLDIEGKPVEQPQISTQPKVGSGRGRLGIKALNLPPPRIIEVTPEDGYPKPLRMAKLPPSYYRNREDPEVQKQRRALQASLPVLINFQLEFDHILIIVDKDDSNEKGYQHACRRLQQIQPDIDINSLKPHQDIWNFGLYIYSIKLDNKISCSLLDLIPEEINNEDNRPYWFMFKRLPIFNELKSISTTPKDNDPRKGTMVFLNPPIRADLSSGALTTMSRFFVHEEHIYNKQRRWGIRFHDEYFEIQTIKYQQCNNVSKSILMEVKYKIPLDIIDRTAIIHLWKNGFTLFINMKGNIHELHREKIDKKDDTYNFIPFKRQGIGKKKARPLFSTIRLRIRLRTDDEINQILDREGKLSNIICSDGKEQAIKEARDESLQQIRALFKNFLEFFNKNRIHICFGPIFQRIASLHQLNTLSNQEFPTFIQSYSWSMLCSIGFRLQIKLFLSKIFTDRLHNYSKPIYSNEQSSDIDDRFYRLCLYLYRRSLEYFFLDLDEEIEIGIQEYKEKYERLKRRKLKMSSFLELNSSTAYIPSVAITPTTIKIRPLKLCKLNRVLREKLFGGVLNFALIELRDEAQRLLFPAEFRSLKDQILSYLTKGFYITPSRIYKYLHHSQSQVKCKQFWFYYHDKTNGYLSHEDGYTWMGNFDKERVVAKHAARIALCFTSTDATIQITADKVTYIRDVKDATKKYAFTDGVGTISTQLRDEVQKFLRRRYAFSVLQIRYGGCKGTLSVDPALDNQQDQDQYQYQLRIRDSMNKFTTDHDILEICKLSAPRALYLNRQDIVLLESRDIPHTNFLNLQNEGHFWLINALLAPSIAYELLYDKVLPVFQLGKIARNLNIVREQFFTKLIITCAFNIIRELIDRTRIQISNEKARNMFGIVDEYGVLEYGQVFFQYTLMPENKLDRSEEERNPRQCKVHTGKVVITKNPCHHPGDLRLFDAVYHQKLAHLKDVVVFPQKGPRPHSNEISGSDLDGDEYVVIWHEDLIPKTPNETPYDYDSQEEPQKMTRPITRDDINQIVMEVSEQDCLGSLSNIHLAYVDREGIKSETCTKLAGHISQEVDAAKTGKHPLSEEEIIKLRAGLNNEWPDFMKARGKKNFYPSERVLGKLYRSARRAVTGWSRAINNHGNPHHIQLALTLTADKDIKDEETNLPYCEQLLDPYIYHHNYEKYTSDIKSLYRTYRSELLEIINLYRFQDEIDLFCRCESMDASAGGSKKGGLEDSASIEVKNLVERITQDFYYEFDQRVKNHKCCKYILKTVRDRTYQERDRTYQKRLDCDLCHEDKLAKAACAYIYSYNQSNRLPLKSNQRILSFPWIFGSQLVKLRSRNNPHDISHKTDTIVGPACSLYLKNFTPKFKVSIRISSIDTPVVEFCYEKIEEKQRNSFRLDKKPDEKIFFVLLLRACFIEILNDWLIKQKVFGNQCTETDSKPLIPESIWHELMIHFLSREHQPNVRLLSASKYQTELTKRYSQTIEEYRLKWTNIEHQDLKDMFNEIHILAVQHAKATESTKWTYLDEYIMLALQCISIEKKLIDNWICP